MRLPGDIVEVAGDRLILVIRAFFGFYRYCAYAVNTLPYPMNMESQLEGLENISNKTHTQACL